MTGQGWWTEGRRRVMPTVLRRSMARARRKGGLAKRGFMSARQALALLAKMGAQ